NFSAYGSYLWQEVSDLGGLSDFKAVGSYSRTRNYIKEGYAPGSHFGAKLIDVPEGQLPVDFNGDGNPDSENQILNYLSTLTPNTAELPTSNNIILQDKKNGDPLGFYKGKPFPDWSGSFGANISYKRFTLNTRFQYKAGNYYINHLTYAFRRQSEGTGRNLKESATVE